MVEHLGLAHVGGRCGYGYAPIQHPDLCNCAESEWSIFVRALHKVVRDGEVHQRDVRPLIRGQIEPNHIGQCYTRAKREGLLREIRREPSDDVVGRNTNKWEPVYELRSAA